MAIPVVGGSVMVRVSTAKIAKKMTELGFSNVHAEKWAFGKGWQINKFYASMTEPQVMPIIGTVRAWTKGTNGPVAADVVQVVITSEADFEQYRGKGIALAAPGDLDPGFSDGGLLSLTVGSFGSSAEIFGGSTAHEVMSAT